jgi:ATP-dependent DNA helicase DinG
MFDIQDEVSRTLPKGAFMRLFVGGTPILYAYGCALLESVSDEGYIYKVVNLETNRAVTLTRRKTPIAPGEIPKVAERIRCCAVAGPGRYEADRPYGKQIDIAKCREILQRVYRDILPKHGYAVRTEQIDLSDEILTAIYRRAASLAEAEVGTGKTLAYLVAAILAKRGRLNDFWNRSFYPAMSYIDMAHMPIVIATSSIALQKAILTEYIPSLSEILLGCGVITSPITAVLRKGREHYVCERKLRSFLSYEQNNDRKQALQKLLARGTLIDLADVEGIDNYTRRKISVPSGSSARPVAWGGDVCTRRCPHHDTCAYLRFRSRANSAEIDIQITNHNYFLADMIKREKDGADKRPLIPNYQTVIIDEAHKFLAAARTMYGTELSNLTFTDIKDSIFELVFKSDLAQKLARKTAKKLSDENSRLFKRLLNISRDRYQDNEPDGEATRLTAVFDSECMRHLLNLRDMSDKLVEILSFDTAANSSVSKADIICDLTAAREQLVSYTLEGGNPSDTHICWLEMPNIYTTPGMEQEIKLCAIPKDLDTRLYDSLWSRGIPMILTSGTLSTGGDFSRVKLTLGLERLGNRLTEISKRSPFDYHENVLLYISDNVPFPDAKNPAYINAVADEVTKLIDASRGHAAILFTSYKVMDMVFGIITGRGLPYPVFRLDKGGVREIEQFKRAGCGVLFAAGSLWEGIDIPGDALSMLIIVKLPFQVPDPISDYEQTQHPNFRAYRDDVIAPEMLMKLKQGTGRLIRTETDTGVVAILDCRANSRGSYRGRVLAALPPCRVTGDISDVVQFMNEKKPPEYFK